MIIFDYIYYRTYFLYKYKWKDDDPKIYSISLVTLMQALNLLSLVFILMYFRKEKLIIDTKFSLILFFVLLGLNFFRYRSEGHFQKFLAKWSKEENSRRIWRGYFIIIYILLSIGVCIKSAFLSSTINTM
jgi:dolichol kinase